jgi:hypothetical protein
MGTGLMVGTFMATGTLVALWMWRTRTLRKFAGIRLGWVVVLLLGITVLAKSVAAVLLMLAGFLSLEIARRIRTSLPILALILVPPTFVAARLSGWGAESVDFRLHNEKLLVEKAKQRPWLGWGRWGRARITDDFGRDISITDSLWVITLGTFGLLALIAQWLTLALPGLALLWRYPARLWADPRLATAAVLAVALQLWVIDDLLNAMVTPIFPAIAGALVSFVSLKGGARARRPRPAALPLPGAGNPTPLAGTHGA